jgi:hypothetical protein
MLGDGYLELPPRGINARLIFSQGLVHKEYFENLNFIFYQNNLLKTLNYRSYTYLDKRNNKDYTTISFKTKSLPILTKFYNIFYINKIKIIPYSLDLLTPLALAH